MGYDLEKVNHASVHVRKRDIIARNFIGGISWGVGSVLGATILVAITLGVLRVAGFIPFIGDFVTQIVEYVENTRK